MKKTPCEELGYKIGDKFLVIDGTDSHYLDKGTIVILYEDDGTEEPKFMVDSAMYSSTKYIRLGDIIPISNTITIPCPKGYEFDGVRHLNYGDSCLANAEDICKWASKEKSTRKYIALKKIKPETMTITLERKEGNIIDKGDYYTNTNNNTLHPVKWGSSLCGLENGTKIWRVVSVETNNS